MHFTLKETMKKLYLTIVIGFIWALVTGCSPTEEVDFSTLEQARAQASQNAEFNAQVFRGQEMSSWSILGASDSTQTKACPQGDGWATLELLNPDKVTRIPIKCSTVSAALGCMLDSTFKTKPYNTSDGKCSTEVPFPIPKIER